MKFVDLFFDRKCLLCSKSIKSGAVCHDCDRVLESIAEVRQRDLKFGERKVKVNYLFDYNNPYVKNLLFTLKRNSNEDLFSYVAKFYERVIPGHFIGSVICCPRSGKSKRNYGYDQVESSIKKVCKKSGGNLKYEKLLKRRGFSKEQKNLDAKERILNTAGKFRVTKKNIPKNILLVDDVITTGSTAISCAEEILRVSPDTEICFAFLASQNLFPGK